MRQRRQRGLTLVELLITIVIMSIIAAGAAGMLSASLQAHAYATARSSLYQEGQLAMERMTAGVRNCTYLLIPNAHTPSRDTLAFSGAVNDDNDYYFGDTLFPRIDEDLGADGDANGAPGLEKYDDDGDSSADEGADEDDDEDGSSGEDPLDGQDNDGDGNVDEDFGADANADASPGIASMDDDGDGSVDEGQTDDDDEDGSSDEDPLNPVLYVSTQLLVAVPIPIKTIPENTNKTTGEKKAELKLEPLEPIRLDRTLREIHPDTGQTIVLSTHVKDFEVLYEADDGTHDPRISITLTLVGDNGETVTFSEYVYPRNIMQKCGKKVQ